MHHVYMLSYFHPCCQIAVWLTNANATLLPPYWRFEPHHIKAIVDTAYEESGFRPASRAETALSGFGNGVARDVRICMRRPIPRPPLVCQPSHRSGS